MATGYTTTGALADSLPTIIASARTTREFEGLMPQLVDKVTLAEGTGLSWNEVLIAAMTAQAVTETTILNNPQQHSDTIITFTPTQAGIETVITDRTARRISKNAFAKLGIVPQEAIQRKKDEDGLTVLDSGAVTCSPGSSTTLTSGHIAAAVVGITSNSTEPGPQPIQTVLHGFQIKDLFDEAVSGLGTYPVPAGLTENVFRSGFKGSIAGSMVYEDGNLDRSTVTSCKGGVFSKSAIILVQGYSPRVTAVRREDIGGGSTVLYHYDEYIYGERSTGNWLYEIESDATAPTS